MKPEMKQELDRIAAANPEGMLVPKAIVATAADPSNPLHSHFTWDDAEAAGMHRENEARRLIQLYVIHEPSLQRKVRAYISVPTDRVEGNGYRRVGDVLDNERLMAQVEQEVIEKIKRLGVSHRHLKSLDGLWPLLVAETEQYLRKQNVALAEAG